MAKQKKLRLAKREAAEAAREASDQSTALTGETRGLGRDAPPSASSSFRDLAEHIRAIFHLTASPVVAFVLAIVDALLGRQPAKDATTHNDDGSPLHEQEKRKSKRLKKTKKSRPVQLEQTDTLKAALSDFDEGASEVVDEAAASLEIADSSSAAVKRNDDDSRSDLQLGHDVDADNHAPVSSIEVGPLYALTLNPVTPVALPAGRPSRLGMLGKQNKPERPTQSAHIGQAIDGVASEFEDAGFDLVRHRTQPIDCKPSKTALRRQRMRDAKVDGKHTVPGATFANAGSSASATRAQVSRRAFVASRTEMASGNRSRRAPLQGSVKASAQRTVRDTQYQMPHAAPRLKFTDKDSEALIDAALQKNRKRLPLDKVEKEAALQVHDISEQSASMSNEDPMSRLMKGKDDEIVLTTLDTTMGQLAANRTTVGVAVSVGELNQKNEDLAAGISGNDASPEEVTESGPVARTNVVTDVFNGTPGSASSEETSCPPGDVPIAQELTEIKDAGQMKEAAAPTDVRLTGHGENTPVSGLKDLMGVSDDADLVVSELSERDAEGDPSNKPDEQVGNKLSHDIAQEGSDKAVAMQDEMADSHAGLEKESLMDQMNDLSQVSFGMDDKAMAWKGVATKKNLVAGDENVTLDVNALPDTFLGNALPSNGGSLGQYRIASEENTTEVDEIVAQTNRVVAQTDDVVARPENLAHGPHDANTRPNDVVPKAYDIATETDDVVAEPGGIVTETDSVVAESDDIAVKQDDVVPHDDSRTRVDFGAQGNSAVFDEAVTEGIVTEEHSLEASVEEGSIDTAATSIHVGGSDNLMIIGGEWFHIACRGRVAGVRSESGAVPEESDDDLSESYQMSQKARGFPCVVEDATHCVFGDNTAQATVASPVSEEHGEASRSVPALQILVHPSEAAVQGVQNLAAVDQMAHTTERVEEAGSGEEQDPNHGRVAEEPTGMRQLENEDKAEQLTVEHPDPPRTETGSDKLITALDEVLPSIDHSCDAAETAASDAQVSSTSVKQSWADIVEEDMDD